MKRLKREGYSKFLKPASYVIDLGIALGAIFLFDIHLRNPYGFVLYTAVCWTAIAVRNKFYEIQRYTKAVQTVALLLRQLAVFALVAYAFIGLFKQPNISRLALGNYLIAVFLGVSFFKLLHVFILNKYRSVLGGNIRRVVIIGDTERAKQLARLFDSRLDFGYKVIKQFKAKGLDIPLEQWLDSIVKNNIDEVYCSLAALSDDQKDALIYFADNNLKQLKFIPDGETLYSKKLKHEYYGYIPIVSLRDIPIEDPVNKVVKRGFDILLALCVIVFVMSWLTPLLAILIKLESKGPVFFKQLRNGLNNEAFFCYKFRSMTPNENAHLHQATKGDHRVTKVGIFIRKTSVDELPQFFNVLRGEMSVVGPRPHMIRHTSEYSQKVDKFMVRHLVKPGITGLAQVSGLRGEIKTNTDIINRTKYDIFYIENWSLLLDIKIVIQTILNAMRWEKKAY